jgi:dGTPase
LCNLADEIAYNAHDIDDGVRSGLITLEQLQEVTLFDDFRRQTLAEHPQLQDKMQGRRLLYESIRRMLSAQVYDVITASRHALQQAQPDSVNAARHLPALIQFSAGMRAQSQALKSFLLQKLYRHPQVLYTTGQGQQVVRDLFACYLAQPDTMPESHHRRQDSTPGRAAPSERTLPRVVADYIAGMTDRFALREHERLTGSRLHLGPV